MKLSKYKLLTINLDKGGAEKVVVSKINYLLKKNYKCDLFLLQNLTRYKLPNNNNFKIYNFYNSFSYKVNFFRKIYLHYKFLKKNFKRSDYVISHLNKANYINILTSLLITHHKTVVVIHNHPNHYIYSSSYFKSYIKFFIHYLIQIFLYRFANEVVTISHSSQVFYKKFFKLNTSLIYNPIDLKFTNSIKPSPDLKISLKKEKIFLSVGSLTKRKNQIEILKTFLYIKNNDYELYNKILLYVIGDGVNFNLLNSYVDKNSLHDSVKIIGLIDDLTPYYNLSSALISSSKAEGLPNIFVEAQSFNKPIITSNYSGYYETLIDNRDIKINKILKCTKLKYGIAYPIGNTIELYKSIKFISYNEKYYTQVVNSLKLKKNIFTVENTQKYIDLSFKKLNIFDKKISVAHIVPNMNYGGVEVGIHRSIDELKEYFHYQVFTVKSKGVMNVNQNNITNLIFKCFFSKHKPQIIITSLWWSHPFGLFFSLLGFKWISFFHSSQYAHFLDIIISKMALKFSNNQFFDSKATLNFHNIMSESSKNHIIPYVFKNKINSNIFNNKDIDFIFVGRNHPNKRLDLVSYLFKIISLKIKNARFMCIIAGMKYKGFHLLEKNANIIIKYNLSNDEVLSSLRRSKFYIQLSDYEGMSMTTIEAIQNYAVPIIRPVGELKNILNDQSAIIINSENKSDLDNSLETIISIFNDKNKIDKINKIANLKINDFPYYTNTIINKIQEIKSE
ncbi:glycosyltransferase [Alphaproteobacteria bacterium]|nr:glycosyltransferase [Alphaproteobacteria bacterium]